MTSTDPGPIRVVGRYALYSEIAAGGMATVHIGRLLGPVGFARTVAIKRLHPQFAKDPEFVSMFLDEARLAARVQHPNVVATIDVVATDGELFLIMDYVRGESLSRLVRTASRHGQRVPPRVAASIVCGFLHGLHAAHEAKNERGEPLNLVHRDVSPQNVLVGADGIARVVDFGVAKAAGRIQVTKDGHVKGKLAYMPPEQLSGREISRAVDIYASAVVMWEALTGERLFKAESDARTVARILRDPVPPPSAIAGDLPRAFDGPLMRALSRDPTHRHPTARALALDIERCAGIATPTEVGEWVERMVGATLSAREDQIAAIESSSVSLRGADTEHALGADSDDSSSVAVDVEFASTPEGTLLGMGPPRRSSARRMAASSPEAPPVMGGIPTPRAATHTRTATATTGTLALPLDRKLPILAAAAAGIVLLTGLGGILVALRGRDAAATGAGAAAPAGSSAGAPPSSVGPAASPSSDTPPPTEAPAPPTSPPDPARPPPSTTSRATARPASTARPTSATPPPTAPPASPPTSKKCDPPYTIDGKGHRVYKRECL